MKFTIPIFLFACSQEEKVTPIEETIFEDSDGDGYFFDEDCDDGNAAIYPGAQELCDGVDNNCNSSIDEDVQSVFYADSDGDGYGNANIFVESCSQPQGFVENGGDCDDTSSQSYPGAEEVCDGLDNNCNSSIDENLDVIFYVDQDGDGFGNADDEVLGCEPERGLSTIAGDCNDFDTSISPLANEICDGIDNNCNNSIDEAVQNTFYADADDDGFGDQDNPIEACTIPFGYIDNDSDCNDTDSLIHPGADESCDQQDNDCDGTIDEEGALGSIVYYQDADGDGYGNIDNTTVQCTQPSGYTTNVGDCDDTNSIFHPGAVEVCNSFDDNCDGNIDEEGAANAPIWYADDDGDGYGDNSSSLVSCTQPLEYIANNTDCDDADNDIHPNASEVCNGEDDNCDGTTDENTAIDAPTWYADNDADGYGNPLSSIIRCTQPSAYVSNAFDCNDSSSTINPDTIWYIDIDGDGFGSELYTTSSCEEPSGYSSTNNDCNDLSTSVYPGGIETCDEQDNDCDGVVDNNAVGLDTWYIDADGDGYGSTQTIVTACDQPTGYVSNMDDCNDAAALAYPNATEIVDGIDNDCDGEGLHGSYNITQSTSITSGEWEYTDLTIASNVDLTVLGSSPLEIYVLGTATIAGNINIQGEDGQSIGAWGSIVLGGSGTAGGGDGGNGDHYEGVGGPLSSPNGSGISPGLGGISYSSGSGGGGGGQVTAGDNGGASGGSYTAYLGGDGGAAITTSIPLLSTGSGGGGGGWGGGYNSSGGGGGGGGGAFFLQAQTIDISGSIDCSGGSGGGNPTGTCYHGGGGGGGSAGTIWLIADEIDVSGSLLCDGGSGGQAYFCGHSGIAGDGGAGSDGYIWIDSATISVTGSISPSYSVP